MHKPYCPVSLVPHLAVHTHGFQSARPAETNRENSYKKRPNANKSLIAIKKIKTFFFLWNNEQNNQESHLNSNTITGFGP